MATLIVDTDAEPDTDSDDCATFLLLNGLPVGRGFSFMV